MLSPPQATFPRQIFTATFFRALSTATIPMCVSRFEQFHIHPHIQIYQTPSSTNSSAAYQFLYNTQMPNVYSTVKFSWSHLQQRISDSTPLPGILLVYVYQLL